MSIVNHVVNYHSVYELTARKLTYLYHTFVTVESSIFNDVTLVNIVLLYCYLNTILINLYNLIIELYQLIAACHELAHKW